VFIGLTNTRFDCLYVVLFTVFSVGAGMAQPLDRSWYHLTTGNGHGFQVFDRNTGRITDFLEHPYQFVAPLDARRDGGVIRRDLAHDVYFGIRTGGISTWLTQLSQVTYEQETHIIHGQASVDSAQVDVRYFAPFGYDGNGLVMVAKVTNTSDAAMDVTLVAKANLKLGSDRAHPNSDGEVISWHDTYGVETGLGGGHMVYYPLGNASIVSCGRDTSIYEAFQERRLVNSRAGCRGDDQVLVMGESSVVQPGQSFWWGQAVLFVNDNPNDAQARDFKDNRSVEDIVALWRNFAGNLGPEALHTRALTEFENWRIAPSTLGLTNLTPEENKVWRQSETVLRMGQIMEPIQINRRNRGMFLAALPTGQWHIGWVRDGAYAVMAQAMNGHLNEARLGLEFFLNAWAGFFHQAEYLGRDYRVSSVRYYGNGKEEGDFNAFGPNVETDGFGLVLWAARAYLHYSCDTAWLDTETLHGDTVFEALAQIAQDIDALTIADLPMAECSIWEVHWDHRKVFTYTAATAIRGLYDFAAIADLANRPNLGNHYRARAAAVQTATLRELVHQPTQSLASSREAAATDVFVDGSTIEMLHWGLVSPNSPIFDGTLQQYERLRTQSGGYRRLEPSLSVNGEPQAGTYDLSEWIMLDLRIGDVFRRIGRLEPAQALLNRVTQAALANDGLIPELFEPDEYGRYAGAVPMVGYGAGVWQMALLEKGRLGAPAIDAGWQHCAAQNIGDGTGDKEMDAGMISGPADMATPDSDSTNANDAGRNAQRGDDSPGPAQERGQPANASQASLCAAVSTKGAPTSWVLIFVFLNWAIKRLRPLTPTS
jgi:GH15 family glucan-1,4-alpha-glucosidase